MCVWISWLLSWIDSWLKKVHDTAFCSTVSGWSQKEKGRHNSKRLCWLASPQCRTCCHYGNNHYFPRQCLVCGLMLCLVKFRKKKNEKKRFGHKICSNLRTFRSTLLAWRFMSLWSLLGFILFCFSYVCYIWKLCLLGFRCFDKKLLSWIYDCTYKNLVWSIHIFVTNANINPLSSGFFF